MKTISFHEPTPILRFVQRDGRNILQQWWSLYRVDYFGNRSTTCEGFWEDVPFSEETFGPPAQAAHYRPVEG